MLFKKFVVSPLGHCRLGFFRNLFQNTLYNLNFFSIHYYLHMAKFRKHRRYMKPFCFT